MSQVVSEQRSLPTGTVTFLFSDIEGSTERWERHREAMKAAVRRHDELMHAAISEHHGHVFKTVGDAFCAAFHTVPDALTAAIEAQRLLAKEDFSSVDGVKVRMAMHTGLADERGGDYFGPTVNRVARLLSVGHGGQILVSGATADLALGEMPPQTTLRDLGSHRLKDLAQPQQVFQLVAADLQENFPSLRSLDALPNNLPLQVTSLVGRDKDVAEVKSLLEKTHLLTLAGPGGVGKTRLALQAGADLLDSYPDGVWIIELGDLTDPELVASEMASVLGIGATTEHSLVESIAYALKPKRTLVILDNCEHLIRTVASLASSIIRTCPNVRLMVTTRQVLGIAGETVHRVASLATPPPTETIVAATALQYSAIALFVDRATAANTRFTLADADAPIVVEICQRLDGIPFAIELAAARVKAMSVSSLAERLHQRFRILTGGDPTGLQRQQTMRALIDWSYNLLSKEEKTLLNRVAVFAGGWTVDVAEQVCALGGDESWELLDRVTSLVDKSLVAPDLSAAVDRYRLLDSTREYVLERLTECGERDRIARKHAEVFLSIARRADEDWHSTATHAWLASLEYEIDNFRAALEWSLSQKNDVELGAALVNALGHFWSEAGLTQEGRTWIESALAALGEGGDSEELASLWLNLSELFVARSRLDAAERARALYEKTGNRFGVARANLSISFGWYHLGRFDEAESACQAARPVLVESRDARQIARCVFRVGSIQFARGEHEVALKNLNESLSQARKLGYDDLISGALTNLAETMFISGDAAGAIVMAQEALTSARRLKNVDSLALGLANITAYQLALSKYEEARNTARDALRYARQGRNVHQLAVLAQHLALVSVWAGDAQRSARLLGFTEAVFARLEYSREPTEAQEHTRLMAALREQLQEDEITALMADGAAFSEEQAIEEALTV